MSTTTLTQVPPGTAAFYDRNLLERAVPADIHGRFGQNRFMGRQTQFGQQGAVV